MKVYTKIVIDIASMKVVEEESYDYHGAVALCGGGGSTSGEVKYPDHMTAVHYQWLNGTGTHNLDVNAGQSITQAMNDAMKRNPYDDTGYQPYDPTVKLALAGADVDMLRNTVYQARADLITGGFVDDYTDELNDVADATIYPRFEAGMRDINAVQSSSFVIGRALIAEGIAKQAGAAYQANMPAFYNMVLDGYLKLAHLSVESNRIGIVAQSEYKLKIIDQRAAARLWNMETFKYGSNVLASIGSASVHTGQKSISPGASALGGAISGAAAAMMMGGGPTSPLGVGMAALGGIAGYLTAI